MRILTNAQIEQMLTEARFEGYLKGEKHGREQGHRKGYAEGLMADKKGVLLTSEGMYHFKDEEMTTCYSGDVDYGEPQGPQE